MSNGNANRKMSRKQKRKQAAVNVFLAMQSSPLMSRLRLARLLVCQSDLRAYAKKRHVSLRSLMNRRK